MIPITTYVMKKLTIKNFLEMVEYLEKDHAPDGWPAIEMKWISLAANALKKKVNDRPNGLIIL